MKRHIYEFTLHGPVAPVLHVASVSLVYEFIERLLVKVQKIILFKRINLGQIQMPNGERKEPRWLKAPDAEKHSRLGDKYQAAIPPLLSLPKSCKKLKPSEEPPVPDLRSQQSRS